MIRRVAHLCFVTDDLERLVKFYTEKLGLPVKFTMKNDAGQEFGFYIDCGDDTFIELFDQALKVKQWGGVVRQLEKGNQYSHLSLEVTALADYRTELVNKGVTVTEISQGMDNSLQAWLKDPDGNDI
ncbi:MAG: VOC family protein, partial [bacterium]